MKNLVFLLEGPSERDALEAWVPKLVPQDVVSHYIVFDGKQDMERRMVLKLRYWQLPHSYFIVVRDQDSADCVAVKRALVERCVEAGRGDAVVRVACHELESFFLGDWAAVAKAFGNAKLADLSRKAAYRDPDRIGSPAEELKKHLSGYQKRDGARRIAPHMNLDCNTSRSFRHLRDAIRRSVGVVA